MANDVEATDRILYSWNEGAEWKEYEFPTGRRLTVDNVVIAPGATSTKFLIYGTAGSKGVLYYIDFSNLAPACAEPYAPGSISSDYYVWNVMANNPNVRGTKCLLGREITYTRRKATSECFNGEQFERPITRRTCECTMEDFFCAEGFAR